jgi:type II secretory ATPase GspE/PulE/Tfp pilus assembly ATPase PilB-like protein
VLELGQKLKGLLLEKASSSLLASAASEAGLITLKEAAWRKVSAGFSTVEELVRLTENFNNNQEEK